MDSMPNSGAPPLIDAIGKEPAKGAPRQMGARPAPGAFGRLVGSPWFWLMVVGIGFALPIIRTVQIKLPPPLPMLGVVPDFSFADEQSRQIGLKDLRGRVWLANFMFTRCPTICPELMGKLEKIQHRTRNLGPSFHIVSFTVDPEFDKPDVLSGYARKYKANPRSWSFLTGQSEDLERVIAQGFKVSAGGGKGADPSGIFHGTHFVLVDAKGNIRGYYDTSSKEKTDELVRDIGLLVNRGN